MYEKYNQFGHVRTEWLESVTSSIATTSAGLFVLAIILFANKRISVRRIVSAPQTIWNVGVVCASILAGVLIVLSLGKFDNPWANLISGPTQLSENITQSWAEFRYELFGVFHGLGEVSAFGEDVMLTSAMGVGGTLLLTILGWSGVKNARKAGRTVSFMEICRQIAASFADTLILAGGALWATLTLAPIIGLIAVYSSFLLMILAVIAAWAVLTRGRVAIPFFWSSR